MNRSNRDLINLIKDEVVDQMDPRPWGPSQGPPEGSPGPEGAGRSPWEESTIQGIDQIYRFDEPHENVWEFAYANVEMHEYPRGETQTFMGREMSESESGSAGRFTSRIQSNLRFKHDLLGQRRKWSFQLRLEARN